MASGLSLFPSGCFGELSSSLRVGIKQSRIDHPENLQAGVACGILSPEGGIIVAMGWSRTASAGRAACEGVASERSEMRSPKPLDYSKENIGARFNGRYKELQYKTDSISMYIGIESTIICVAEIFLLASHYAARRRGLGSYFC